MIVNESPFNREVHMEFILSILQGHIYFTSTFTMSQPTEKSFCILLRSVNRRQSHLMLFSSNDRAPSGLVYISPTIQRLHAIVSISLRSIQGIEMWPSKKHQLAPNRSSCDSRPFPPDSKVRYICM